MSRSIFDGFVSINETYGAISMVYAKKKYYLFVELLSLVDHLWTKQIGIMFYDDFLSTAPLIKYCHYQYIIQSRIKFGIFQHEDSKLGIREWMEQTTAISSTWQVSVTKLQQWYKDIEMCAQKSISNLDAFKTGIFHFDSFSHSPNYNWTKYKLSQLQISSFKLHI